MKIGIAGPVNPDELKDFLYKEQKIQPINKGATAVNTYIKELLRKGHSVIVFTSEIPSNEKESYIIVGEKLQIHVICSKPGVFLTHALSRIYMIRRLRNYMRNYINDIDVLHAQWTYDFALAAKAFECHLPVFCTVRDWCPYIMSLQKGLRNVQWKLYYCIFRKVMSSNNIHFIANSEYTYSQIIKMYPNKQIEIIYNPIDKDYILDKRLYELHNDVFISIAISLTEGRKNVYRLLEAFHLLRKERPNSQLKLVGNGFENSTKEYKLYSSLGLLEGVSLLGQLNHTKLIEEIDKSTCLIHPSLEETFGNILVEGMARRVPVIGGKNSGAVPQVLGNGVCGILCDVEDISSIKEAMNKACDKEYTKKIVEEATKNIKEKFSSDSIVNRQTTLYRIYCKNKVFE